MESAQVIPRAGGSTLLQRVILDREVQLRALYWREPFPNPGMIGVAIHAGALRITPGATVAFDTYFNALFERQWRTYTTAEGLVLDLDLQGQALLRIWRRSAECGSTLLHEAVMSDRASLELPSSGQNFRQAGLVWFELTALSEPVTLVGAAWSTRCAPAKVVALAVVICTFNRETEVAQNLARIAADTGLDKAVSKVIVVNQGRPGLVKSPAIAQTSIRLGTRLHVVEQANMGGAGGFARGMMEALADPEATHLCLLDDDVRLEPESLLRMAAFFSLAVGDFAIGGHMLDSMQPLRLFEAGARVATNGFAAPLKIEQDLTRVDALDKLLEASAMHFNGWWMFGLPKSVLRQVGLPLPCFIRGDDVEFGLRLHERGIFTLPVPGMAIWHEPFYVKMGGWAHYYEARNAVICAALHDGFLPRQVAFVAFCHFMVQLLTLRYYGAVLVLRAYQDFLLGPMVLDQDPRPLHEAVVQLRKRYAEERTPRERVLSAARVGGTPRSRAAMALKFVHATARHWLTPDRPQKGPELIDAQDFAWFRVIGADYLAVDTHWDLARPTYRRDRATFRALLRAGLAMTYALYRAAPRLRAEWRAAAPRFASVAFWRQYLGLPDVELPAVYPHRLEKAARDRSGRAMGSQPD